MPAKARTKVQPKTVEAHGVAVEVVPIDSVMSDPANARRHGPRNLDAIKASLHRFGQQKPIVVDATGVIRAGNGTWEAARALGWTEILVIRSRLAGVEATAYAIADNRSGDLAEWDETALAETLRAIQSDGVDMPSVGYTDDEVDGLLEDLGSTLLATDHQEAGDGEDGGATPSTALYPLAVVLDRATYNRWLKAKEGLGVTSDQAAFLRLLDGVSAA